MKPKEIKYKRWAIVYKPEKPGVENVAKQLSRVLKTLGASPKLFKAPPRSFAGFHAAASVGGDGTLLSCVGAALTSQVPLVGVNMGKLGYLTGISRSQMRASFKNILLGRYRPTPRMVLKATLQNGSAAYGLNDLVIKSAEYRLAELKVSVDGEGVTEFDCDGIIFATPSGSTAYNLSAGGPIVHLKTEGIVMTPICAHTLTNRSVLFNSKSRLKITQGKRPCVVHVNVDGRTIAESRGCLPIQVRQATRKLITLEDPRRGHFQVLREKLGWR